MRYFPMFVDLSGKECLVLGTTGEARRKAGVLRAAGANVRAEAVLDSLPPARLCGFALAVVATGDEAEDAAAAATLSAQRVPVNVVDRPALCTFIWPAIVDRDPVTIAISTGGTSPLLAKLLRLRIERAVPAAFGVLAALAGSVRQLVRQRLPDGSRRRRFWHDVLTGPVSRLVIAGQPHRARALLYRELLRR